MDILQHQITEVSDKVDDLYKILERISLQISELASKKQQASGYESELFPTMGHTIPSSAESHRNLMEHKDILIDGNDLEYNGNSKKEQVISPDLQIRRLTAQLTAAYNRIAALEEQLLARRIRS